MEHYHLKVSDSSLDAIALEADIYKRILMLLASDTAMLDEEIIWKNWSNDTYLVHMQM